MSKSCCCYVWSGFWSYSLFLLHEVDCNVSLLNRTCIFLFIFFFFDQSQMSSAGPTSGNATSGTARICDANAPEGKSVISAIVRQHWSSSEMLEELATHHQRFIPHKSSLYQKKARTLYNGPFRVEHCSVIFITIHYSSEGVIPRTNIQ